MSHESPLTAKISVVAGFCLLASCLVPSPLFAGQTATQSPNCANSGLIPKTGCTGQTTCTGGGCQASSSTIKINGVNVGFCSTEYNIVANVGPGCILGTETAENPTCGLNTSMYCGTSVEYVDANCTVPYPGPTSWSTNNIYICICTN